MTVVISGKRARLFRLGPLLVLFTRIDPYYLPPMFTIGGRRVWVWTGRNRL